MGGVPRHYYSITAFDFSKGFMDIQVFITIAAIIGFVAQFFFLYNFFSSIFYGKKAPANPWKANTLEWTTPRNPGHGNWPGDIPKVYRWSYDYSKPGVKEDYLPQHIPDTEVEYEEGYQIPEVDPHRVPVEIEKKEQKEQS